MARSKHLRFWVSLWPHLIALPFTAGAALGFYFSPNPIPWLAPLALAWPALLLWHGAWTLWAASQFKSSALVGLLLLALTWPQTRGWVHVHTGPAEDGDFRVATWNVHQWRNLAWTDQAVTEERMQQAALDLHADILAIQENRLNSGPQRSLEAWYPYSTPHEDQGLQIFSKYPIQQWNFEAFEASYPGHRGFVWADIQTPKGLVRVVNIHLVTTTFVTREAEAETDSAGISTSVFSSAYKLTRTAKIRAQQVDQLLAWASTGEQPPLIWLGDFNDSPTSNTAYRLRSWKDAFEEMGKGFGSTYRGLWGLPLRIDWILHDAALQATGLQRVEQADSDHHPVWVNLAFNAPDAG